MGKKKKNSGRLYRATCATRLISLNEALASAIAEALSFLDIVVAVYCRDHNPGDFYWDNVKHPVKLSLIERAISAVEPWDKMYGYAKTGSKTVYPIWGSKDLLDSDEFIESLNRVIVNVTDDFHDDVIEDMQEDFGMVVGLALALTYAHDDDDGVMIASPKYIKMRITLLKLAHKLLTSEAAK